MHPATTFVESGPLADVDLVQLGAKSGLLWRSGDVVLAGLGEADRFELDLHGAADSAEKILRERTDPAINDLPGTGAVGFTTLPFGRTEPGAMFVAPVVVGSSGGRRFFSTLAGTSAADVMSMVHETTNTPHPVSPNRIDLVLDRAADAWRDDVVAAARNHIASGSMRKAVFARVLELRADREFPISTIVCDLARRFDRALLFSIDGFVGASPELLVSRAGRTVRAHPLAGTAARLGDPASDATQIASLLSSSKDRLEHRITIDWLLVELLRFCSYVDAEPEPSILSLANVHHLGTIVEGVLSEPAASVLDLVAAVHPTPAVGGDPQPDALALIDELEGFDRGRYGGPTGWVDAAGNGEFAVSVRTAQIRGTSASIAAGVGVVAQSDPESELIETQAKLRAMLGTFLRL